MRRFVLLLVCIVFSITAKAQFAEFVPVVPDGSGNSYFFSPPQRNSGSNFNSHIQFNTFVPVIPQSETVVIGETYKAIILYNSSTGHENTYELPVIVNNGYVQKICFNNGGSLHVGQNNSGYTYYGGKLEYVKEIDALATVVKIVYSNGSWQEFTIVL